MVATVSVVVVPSMSLYAAAFMGTFMQHLKMQYKLLDIYMPEGDYNVSWRCNVANDAGSQ